MKSDLENARKQISDYAMALDLLARISHSDSEKQAIEKYAWTRSEKGFWVKIYYQKTPIGIVEINEISFKEYKEQYLNLALSTVEACGLVIENARRQEQLKEIKHNLRQRKGKS